MNKTTQRKKQHAPITETSFNTAKTMLEHGLSREMLQGVMDIGRSTADRIIKSYNFDEYKAHVYLANHPVKKIEVKKPDAPIVNQLQLEQNNRQEYTKAEYELLALLNEMHAELKALHGTLKVLLENGSTTFEAKPRKWFFTSTKNDSDSDHEY